MHASGVPRDALPADQRPQTPEGKLLTPKQIRARARRKMARSDRMSDLEFEALYKPVEEWDLEELARGRPRGADGSFRGPKPKWISREVHERSMERFKAAIRTEVSAVTVHAHTAILGILQNDEVDEKGKPIVPASTKLDAAKFLIEHAIGKPVQHVENDISVKLQGILGVVMANPSDAFGPDASAPYQIGHLPNPQADADAISASFMDDDDDLDEGGEG